MSNFKVKISNLSLVFAIIIIGFVCIFFSLSKSTRANLLASDGFILSPDAISTIYQNGVPQIQKDESGGIIGAATKEFPKSYDPQKSIFPLFDYQSFGIEENGGKANYDLLKSGNMNTVIYTNSGLAGQKNPDKTAKTIWQIWQEDPKYANMLQQLKEHNFYFFIEYPDSLYNYVTPPYKPYDKNYMDYTLIKNLQNNPLLLGYFLDEEMNKYKDCNAYNYSQPNFTKYSKCTYRWPGDYKSYFPNDPLASYILSSTLFNSIWTHEYDFFKNQAVTPPNGIKDQFTKIPDPNHLYGVLTGPFLKDNADGSQEINMPLPSENIRDGANGQYQKWTDYNNSFDFVTSNRKPQIFETLSNVCKSSGCDDHTGSEFSIPYFGNLFTQVTQEQKPNLVLLPAYTQKQVLIDFSKQEPKWELATSRKLPSALLDRAMTYSAIINGATGIGHFTMDNADIRLGEFGDDTTVKNGTIGPRGDTPVGYNESIMDCLSLVGKPDWTTYRKTPCEFKATPEEITKSQELYKGITQTNSELTEHKNIILQPTSKTPYEVYIKNYDTVLNATNDQNQTLLEDGKYGDPNTNPENPARNVISNAPVHTMLKQYNGKYYLIAVNYDARQVDARFQFDFPIKSVKALKDWTTTNTSGIGNFNGNLSGTPIDRVITPSGNYFQDPFSNLTTHIYEITPKESIKITSSKTYVSPGQEITYTITLTNQETGQITNAIITSPIPSGTQFVSASDNGQSSDTRVIWGPFILQKDESKQVTFKVKISP